MNQEKLCPDNKNKAIGCLLILEGMGKFKEKQSMKKKQQTRSKNFWMVQRRKKTRKGINKLIREIIEKFK